MNMNIIETKFCEIQPFARRSRFKLLQAPSTSFKHNRPFTPSVEGMPPRIQTPILSILSIQSISTL
jgi:hypothetical protein